MSRVVAASPVPRRIKKPSWLDVRLALGLVLVLGSVVLGALVIGRAHTTVQVVVATHNLSEGSVLSGADLKLRHVQLGAATLSQYAREPEELIGRRLTAGVLRDELVPIAAALSSPPSTSLAIPLAEGMAPSLRAGQRIEVWLTTPACGSIVLLPDATVQSIHSLDSSFASSGSQSIILSLEPALASRVIAALDIPDAHIRAGILTGSHQAADHLADIATCVVSPATHR